MMSAPGPTKPPGHPHPTKDGLRPTASLRGLPSTEALPAAPVASTTVTMYQVMAWGAGEGGCLSGSCGLVDHERLLMAGAVGIGPAGAAVARRRARHRTGPCLTALVEGGGAGHLDGLLPDAVHLTGDERLLAAGAVGVPPGGGAVARRRARHRTGRRVTALVEGGGAGHLDGGTPGGVHLAGDERLRVAGAVGVPPGGGAVARRRARHRTGRRVTALVEGGGARDLDGLLPDAVHLAGHERLLVARAVGVLPGGAAVARRRARHRVDPRATALVEGGGAGHLDGRMPDAVHLSGHERPAVTGADVASAGGAVARRRARHRIGHRDPAPVEGGGARDLDGLLPGAVHLAGDQRLLAAGAVGVVPSGGTVARHGARHPHDRRGPALVEGGGAGQFPGGAPGAVPLTGHQRLLAA